jgi:molybdate transport system ATP-binding protein
VDVGAVSLEVDLEVRLGDLHLAVAFAVEAGETVAVVGPNGAGKTTLLRALAGLVALDAGRVVLDGTVLDDVAAGVAVPAEARRVGVVFQDHLLFPHLRAVDNVAFGLRSRGAGKADADARARAWLERVGLADVAAARPRALSGGQAQRVALARALAIDPHLLLLDEPLAALDASTRTATRRELRRHLADHPGVRLLVTHDPLEAAALADRVVVVEAGRVVQKGTVAALTAHPRSRYVADLVGVNLVEGRASGGRVRVAGADLELVLADRVEGDVLLAIPPRAVTLSPERPAGTARNVWPGVVDGVDHVGDRARVRVRGPVVVVAEVTDAAARDLGLVAGTVVGGAVKATEIAAAPA